MSTAACPRCSHPLAPQGTRRMCTSCTGAWIGDDEFRQLVYGLAPDLNLAIPIQFATRSTIAPLTCPDCSELLRPIRFARVPLDRCERDRCVWFDHDELRQVLENVGLDYADRERVRQSDDRQGIPDAWVFPLEPDPPQTGLGAWFRKRFGQSHRPEP